MTALRPAWDRLWFDGGDARNLAAARIIVAVHALWMLLSRDVPALSGLPLTFWYEVRTEVRDRFLLVPGVPGIERAVEWIAIAALILVALGVAVRWSAVVAALALYHLAPLQTLLATTDPINRGFTIATLSLVVLSASRCADAWAVRAGTREHGEAWEYAWPLRLMWLFVAEIYLFGAIGKLRSSGWTWFEPENLRRSLMLYLHMYPDAPDPLVRSLSSRTTLLRLSGLGVLAVEGLFVTALWSRRARRVLVPAAFVMHLCILRTMRIVFANLAHLGLFVNWAWLADRLTIDD